MRNGITRIEFDSCARTTLASTVLNIFAGTWGERPDKRPMLRAVSTYIFVKERLHPGLLDKLVSGGAQAIEIFGARQHLDYANRKQHVREIADWFRSSGVPLHSG